VNAAWEIVVGIETHAQLATQSKIFSGASTAFGASPNSQASAVDIALPGVLPVLNRAAVELAIRFGLAVGGPDAISRRSIFARKNYFYPDLPKGYQISQFELPIVKGGVVEVESPTRGKIKVRLTRAHLEEDAGKSLHEGREGTGIDLNRAGTPLLEIVSEPELLGAAEAVAYARALHEVVTWNGISDGDMEEGSFRCDANVSVRRIGDAKLGTRCEIKNLNSFLFMEQAIEFEARRQIEVLEAGGKIVQETRLFDPDKGETRPMRVKEDAHDYRYFPDPDLLPVVVTTEMIARVQESMPKPKQIQRKEFIENYSFSPALADSLTSSNATSTFAVSAISGLSREGQLSVANWIIGPLKAQLNRAHLDFSQSKISSVELKQLYTMVANGEISASTAVGSVLPAMWEGQGSARNIVETRGLKQISDAGEIEKLVDEAIAAGAKQVADYRAGKEKALQSLVGQVMKASKGKANPAQVNEILRRKLGG
jgi:aspartyl-tRNA(Asn)/glutamyl-tRNA(Gln) amidotransferase subunit B